MSGVLGTFNLLYGDERYLLEYAKMLREPTFNEARAALRVARRLLDLAKEALDALEWDRLFREAFDSLFHAAGIAAMTYLSTEVSRWGLLRRMLSEPYNNQFKEFINVLYIEYFYHGNYPRDNIEEELNKWCNKVEKFIESLESELRKKRK